MKAQFLVVWHRVDRVFKMTFFIVSCLQYKLLVNHRWCHDVWKHKTFTETSHDSLKTTGPATDLTSASQRSYFCLFKRQICRWHGPMQWLVAATMHLRKNPFCPADWFFLRTIFGAPAGIEPTTPRVVCWYWSSAPHADLKMAMGLRLCLLVGL
jgi:hypothetical protein